MTLWEHSFKKSGDKRYLQDFCSLQSCTITNSKSDLDRRAILRLKNHTQEATEEQRNQPTWNCICSWMRYPLRLRNAAIALATMKKYPYFRPEHVRVSVGKKSCWYNPFKIISATVSPFHSWSTKCSCVQLLIILTVRHAFARFKIITTSAMIVASLVITARVFTRRNLLAKYRIEVEPPPSNLTRRASNCTRYKMT